MSGLYNRDTCFEFHQLLVSTLLSFGKGLEEYEKAYHDHQSKQDPKSFAVLVSCAQQVYECGILLRSIAYSRILENHLIVLHDEGLLTWPVNSKESLGLYFAFTGFISKKNKLYLGSLAGLIEAWMKQEMSVKAG
jgi:hypothetical protein